MTDVLMWHLMVTAALAGTLLLVVTAQTARAVVVRAGRAARARRVPRLGYVQPLTTPISS